MGFWYFLTLFIGIFLLFRWISARKNNQANKATLFISVFLITFSYYCRSQIYDMMDFIMALGEVQSV